MTESDPNPPRKRGILSGLLAGEVLGPGLFVLPGQGNSLAIETDAGVVLIDASAARNVEAMISTLREQTDSPIHAIVYSHGHNGYNASVDLWQQHNAERGDPPARQVGHKNILKRYDRYRETAELQLRMLAMQFPSRQPVPLASRVAGMALHDVTETFDDTMTLVDGSRRVDLIWAPSETDDALVVWLPDDGVLFGGAATPDLMIPNIGTPLRTQRFTIRWAETLEQLADLGATKLVTEFGPVVEGDDIAKQLLATADALRWLRNEVVTRMNAGMDEREILADMTYPAEMFDVPWMRPSYGSPDYIVRDLYREENGWWDRNPTTLHPAPPADAAAAVLSAIADPQAVLDKARALAESGETQLALHVIDLLALGDSDDPVVREAKAVKAELCNARAAEVQPFVSRSCLRSSANLLAEGHTSWQNLS